MSLFSGKPNPGYLGVIIFTDSATSTAVTLPCDTYTSNEIMEWTRADIFNSNGYRDHAKGLSDGTVIASGTWDTGKNLQTTMKVGTVGSLSLTLNANPDTSSCAQAKIAAWTNTITAPGRATWVATFIIDGAINNFAGVQFNNPSISS